MTCLDMTRFQSDFAKALFEHDESRAARWLIQPAFAVYRNTVMKGCLDALEANYPSIVRLVGHEWFRSAAAVFVGKHPPRDGALVDYGCGFPAFLRSFEPAAELTYLPDVARLDRFWTESHTAADAMPLSAGDLAQLAPDALTACRLVPHPAARWAWFDEQPIYSIWARNRTDAEPQDELLWRSEGALLTRPQDAVLWQSAGRADCAFMEACAAGRTLSEAAERAHQADLLADLTGVVARLLSAGAICEPSTLQAFN
jgi:hypothetical protein